jgi:hypothetical protein
MEKNRFSDEFFLEKPVRFRRFCLELPAMHSVWSGARFDDFCSKRDSDNTLTI